MFIRLAGLIRESIVDGPGIRFVVFSQGCPHACVGCHNPESHSLDGGYETSIEHILDLIKSNPMITGVTFSGGEPFLQAQAFAELAKRLHKLSLDIITYTGYTFERLYDSLQDNPSWRDLLLQTDTLIDGPFILKQKSLLLPFRGSNNQRIIDSRKSVEAGFVIEKDFK